MSKSVSDKINDGDYKNKLPFASFKKDKAAANAYHEEERRLTEQFKTDALIELDRLRLDYNGDVVFKHSKADTLWAKAWEHGHAYGLSEVWIYLQDFDELLS